jgi:hypothetical protein
MCLCKIRQYLDLRLVTMLKKHIRYNTQARHCRPAFSKTPKKMLLWMHPVVIRLDFSMELGFQEKSTIKTRSRPFEHSALALTFKFSNVSVAERIDQRSSEAIS